MFVVTLRYVAPLPEIDASIEDHVRWLDEGYAANVFLASGRQIPREGGVILAGDCDRAALERWVARDPFAVRGLAEHEIVEFVATKTAPSLEQLLSK